MFTHNFKNILKVLLRNKTLIFWTFAFPLILGTFFNMAFSNIADNEKIDIIDIAIIENNELNDKIIFKSTFEKLSDKKNKNRLFNIKYTSEKEAKKLLEKEKIIGYVELVDGKSIININNNGIDQTIFKYVVEEISENNDIINDLVEKEVNKEIIMENYEINYEEIYSKVLNILEENNIKINDISSKNIDYSMIEFYTLIAMTCMYGGILSIFVINQNLANMSNKGKRISVSPTSKITVIISSLLASYIIQIIGLTILFMYTIFILNINYGDNLYLIILLACIGSLAGLALGLLLGTILKTTESTKTGILIAITMIGCFFSGMFGISMKYIIDKNMPIINYLNPVNMITDGFYSLYYYETLNRYYFNIISLLIFSCILILLSFIGLRRQKYDSI